jgi:hypothetical protein
VIKPGTVINEIGAHEDMLPTLLAATGDTTVKDDLLTGRKVGDTTYKVHLDGHNLLPALKGEGPWPRQEFIYWTDDGSVAALRYGNWKATFLRQDAHGLHAWLEPFVKLRAPLITNLRMDPFELAHEIGMDYNRWYVEQGPRTRVAVLYYSTYGHSALGVAANLEHDHEHRIRSRQVGNRSLRRPALHPRAQLRARSSGRLRTERPGRLDPPGPGIAWRARRPGSQLSLGGNPLRAAGRLSRGSGAAGQHGARARERAARDQRAGDAGRRERGLQGHALPVRRLQP